MSLVEVIEADVSSVFFGELASCVTYKQGESEYEVHAVIAEQEFGVNDELDVEFKNEAKIYVSKSELDGLGITPELHDLIDNKWKVGGKKLNFGVYELTCYRDIRVGKW